MTTRPKSRSQGAPASAPVSRRAFLGGAVGATTAWATVAAGARQAGGEGGRRRAAVIGHTGRGDYGHGLDEIFRGRPGIEVVAVADPHEAGRAKVAAKIGARRAYADYCEMLDRERPEMVSLAMRHADQHHAIGLACLRAGAHGYFEKPFTRTPAEADELLAEATRRGLQIAVAHTMRMTPPVVGLRKALTEGLLGEVRELRAYGKQDARAGGEDMMVLGTHLFDLMRFFCGDPHWVSAQVLVAGRPIRREDRRLVRDNVGWVAGDQVVAHFGFGDGVHATFTSDGRLRETIGHWGIEILGTRGAARLNGDLAPNVFIRQTTGWSAAGRSDIWKPMDADLSKAPQEHNLGPVDDWLEAVAAAREPECSGRNGAWAVEMAMGIYQASLDGRQVSFPLDHRHHPLEGI